jgi:hypothetical protein
MRQFQNHKLVAAGIRSPSYSTGNFTFFSFIHRFTYNEEEDFNILLSAQKKTLSSSNRKRWREAPKVTKSVKKMGSPPTTDHDHELEQNSVQIQRAVKKTANNFPHLQAVERELREMIAFHAILFTLTK